MSFNWEQEKKKKKKKDHHRAHNEDMNVDQVVNWFFLPLLQYPLFTYFVFWIPNTRICILLIFYSVILQVCIALNRWFKCRGSEPWNSLADLSNAVVLVTGGSSGLGRSIIVELLNRFKHIKVINLDLQESPQADARIIDIQCDLKDGGMLNHCLERIKAGYGHRLALIINNAGIRAPFRCMQDLDELTVQNVFAINTFAPMKIVKKLVTSKHQCYVINVASTLGILAPAKVSTYAASKAALVAFHNSYNFELISQGISNVRVLLVLSGQLDTNMFGGFDPPLQFFAPVIDRQRLARKLVDCCEKGQRGEMCVPFYSNYAHLLMSLPLLPRYLIRKLTKMDDCLPQE